MNGSSSGSPQRVPVRATFAFAGAGSLGTFLSAAAREMLLAIRAHNAAVREAAAADDPRWLNERWGRVTIDSLGGSSAGALCAAQVIKSIYDPSYLNDGGALDASRTFTGDWVRGGDFARLAVVGNTPTSAGPIEAPGWTLISGARLFELAAGALEAVGDEPLEDPDSPLDPSGLVAVAVTLTDLLGFHAPAEFDPERVAGHPSFGRPPVEASRVVGRGRAPSRDLGGRGHAEVRKLFVARDDAGVVRARRYLTHSYRRGRARTARWGDDASRRLAALAASSAALPLAVGPLAMTDTAGDTDQSVRRLYMDGGILNNKPIAPALKLARWHEGARLMGEGGLYTVGDVREALVYERVCFFFDAFPDRTRDEWRSDHPDVALSATGVYRLTSRATEAREMRIDEALAVPTAAMDVFFESMLTSLRAQDILGIAKTNGRLHARDRYIDERIEEARGAGACAFPMDSVDKARALAAVLHRPAAAGLSDGELCEVARRVWESDSYSGLGGRRPVTMVPVFAPENLKAVLAGEGLYAVGGLLDIGARRHDAEVGRRVAQEVLDGIRCDDDTMGSCTLPHAPDEALPADTSALVERLRVWGTALIDAVSRRPNPVRFLAKLPLQLSPLIRMARRRLDRAVRSPGDPLHPEDD